MKPYSDYSDEYLFTSSQHGDDAAFHELYVRFFPILYVHAKQKIGDSQEAKDLVQDTFTSLYHKKAELGEITNFAGYLYVLLKNRILNFIAKKSVRTNYLDTLDVEHYSRDVEHYIFERELKEQIENGINHLPEKMKLVFLMSRYEHLSHKEIGERLDISDKTVKRQIVNALKIIKSKLHILISLFFL